MSDPATERLGLTGWLLVHLGRFVLAALFRLNRVVVKGEEFLAQACASDRPVFMGFWHDRMIYPLWYLRRYRPVALVSQSSDGDIMAALLESWGYATIRGSSTRGSREALRAMIRIRDKPDLLIVNAMDGPVGPARVAKVGGLALAAKKEAALIPMAAAASRYWTFKQSWDRFQLPKPFGRIMIQFGPPMEVAPDMDAEALARRMGQRITQLEQETDAVAASMV